MNRALLFCLAFLITGCQPTEPATEPPNPETPPLIDIWDDAYSNTECWQGNDPEENGSMYGSLRCKGVVVTEEQHWSGQVLYNIDLFDCHLPVLGDNWNCNGRLFKTNPPASETPVLE